LAGVLSEITLSRQRLKGGQGVQHRRVRSRTVPLNPQLKAALQTYLDERFEGLAPAPDDFLFASRIGENRPISRVQAYRILKSAAAATGRPERIATHSLRKTFAHDVFARSGHDLVLTQRALGHSSVVTTARYVSPDEGAVSAAILGLGAPFGRAESFTRKEGASVPLVSA
jgi:site-specific recombinase XerD